MSEQALRADDKSDLHASAPGFTQMIRRDEQTHAMLPESVIAGRVIDEHGDRLGGHRLPERLDWSISFADSFAITDAKGRARMSSESGRRRVAWPISAARPGEFGSDVAPADAEEITIRLQPIQ